MRTSAPAEKKTARDIQYQNLLTKYEELQARVAADQAVRVALTGKPRRLLEEIALTMLRADEAAEPSPAEYKIDGDRISGRPFEYAQPGASTRRARKARDKLWDGLERALITYGAARQRNFAPLEKSQVETVPRVRCRIRDCSAVDVELEAWRTIRGGRRIYHERCMSCGGMLTPA